MMLAAAYCIPAYTGYAITATLFAWLAWRQHLRNVSQDRLDRAWSKCVEAAKREALEEQRARIGGDHGN